MMFNYVTTYYSRTHVIRILRGPRNLFELRGYSNYRSSDNMSSTILINNNKSFLTVEIVLHAMFVCFEYPHALIKNQFSAISVIGNQVLGF